MSIKTKKLLFNLAFSSFFLFFLTLIATIFSHGLVKAETIGVDNPLEYDDVNSLASQIRSYLLMIVGGIAIVFIAISGILYIFAGITGNDNLVGSSKKALLGSVVGLIVILMANILLDEVYFIVLGQQLSFAELSIKDILVRLVNFLLAIVGTLAVITFVIGGIWYLFGGADQDKIQRGKQTVKYGIIGIVVALSGIIIIRQISAIIGG